MAWVVNSDYKQYQEHMLEIAFRILSNVSKYIETEPEKYQEKYSCINDLMNFFYFESEYEIYEELSVVMKALIIKKYIGVY